MFPELSLQNPTQLRPANPIFLGERDLLDSARRVPSTDFADIVRRQFRPTVTLSRSFAREIVAPDFFAPRRVFLPTIPPSLQRILHVRALRSWNEMLGATTEPVIAGMTDHQPGRNLAVGEVVGKAMSADLNPALIAKAQVHKPIAITGNAARPDPATSGAIAINTVPKLILLPLGKIRDSLRSHLKLLSWVPRPGLFTQRRDISVFASLYPLEV